MLHQEHIPIMISEFLNAHKESHIKTFVDGTLGLGGHAHAILSAHPEIETFIGIDEDPIALRKAADNLKEFKPKLKLLHGNFRDMDNLIKPLNMTHVDGIFLDIGVSSMQMDNAERGMSFMREGPLDMRRDNSSPKGFTADTIVNSWSEKELQHIFRDYGEEPRWRNAAKTLVEARKSKPIKTTTELVEILRPVLRSKRKINPMTLVFQALRIAVNDELGALGEILPKAIEMLNQDGILGVISFHSLEDRLVKQIFRLSASKRGFDEELPHIILPEAPTVQLITKKPLTAAHDETRRNPRSRSAKMRFIKKI